MIRWRNCICNFSLCKKTNLHFMNTSICQRNGLVKLTCFCLLKLYIFCMPNYNNKKPENLPIFLLFCCCQLMFCCTSYKRILTIKGHKNHSGKQRIKQYWNYSSLFICNIFRNSCARDSFFTLVEIINWKTAISRRQVKILNKIV